MHAKNDDALGQALRGVAFAGKPDRRPLAPTVGALARIGLDPAPQARTQVMGRLHDQHR
ncbi:hypothetical protein C4K04_1137 [Pseudomonas chlororaphis]|uniref:Uncharacterized protein n=1 Tax=Pseudomonas chlororaphis TaxID=587753 RepID=A0A3G7TKG0_9PSED|nr:hypothetical protein [Pseudomonas chlororaphis]AZE46829.1 hypothetical protein C4K04_1137 [Pseudomonas chlororaphis]